MRSLLFAPADSERKIAKALAGDADIVILDLEDSVAPERKHYARETLADVLATPHSGPRRFVRVNPLDTGLTRADLDHILPHNPDGLVQPKTNAGTDVETLTGMAGYHIPIVVIASETAASLFTLNTYTGLKCNLVGLAWGAEDLSNELGAQTNRDETGQFTDPYRLARTLCLAGARSAGVEPVDTVFTDFRDAEGLRRECAEAVRDGFTAKMAIHPDQVPIINEVFTPSPEQVAEAQRVVDAFAEAGNPGVINLDGKMYDIPHLKRANKLLERASRPGN